MGRIGGRRLPVQPQHARVAQALQGDRHMPSLCAEQQRAVVRIQP